MINNPNMRVLHMNIRKRLQSIMENDLVHQGEISMDRIEWTGKGEISFDETNNLSTKGC